MGNLLAINSFYLMIIGALILVAVAFDRRQGHRASILTDT